MRSIQLNLFSVAAMLAASPALAQTGVSADVGVNSQTEMRQNSAVIERQQDLRSNTQADVETDINTQTDTQMYDDEGYNAVSGEADAESSTDINTYERTTTY